MPRPRKERTIEGQPKHDYFSPRLEEGEKVDEVILSLVELECLRLSNLCKMNQTMCADRMGIHQSTFHRMLNSAREKIADALVNGKAIKIEGGKFVMRSVDEQDLTLCGTVCGKGPGGKCVCPKCGYTTDHQKGVPCSTMNCPDCGKSLVREWGDKK
ncbi:MAG: DUF134 domain-containing protein [Candidatus Methanofastidiosa archaeon]|nr:DUF134 domain-containing protein [Candidatus Methanofastidiosa archaeon]